MLHAEDETRAMLIWFPDDYESTCTGSFTIKSDSQGEGFEFTHEGEYSEVAPSNTIAKEQAGEILNYFKGSGKRHPEYEWESD